MAVYEYSNLKGVLKVGDKVKAVKGKNNPCNCLKNGKTGTITKITDERFWIDGCFHFLNRFGCGDWLEIVEDQKKLKVGDTCKVKEGSKDHCINYRDACASNAGKEMTIEITKIGSDGRLHYSILANGISAHGGSSCYGCFCERDLEKLEEKTVWMINDYGVINYAVDYALTAAASFNQTKKEKNTNMSKNIVESYQNSLIAEPLKTLIETGVKFKDNTLTSSGKELLLEILGKKHEADLLEVANMLKAESKNNDKSNG